MNATYWKSATGHKYIQKNDGTLWMPQKKGKTVCYRQISKGLVNPKVLGLTQLHTQNLYVYDWKSQNV